MKTISALISFAGIVLVSTSLAFAQADPITAGIVVQGLTQAIGDMRSALNEATNDAKSVGNSYQANAQNVLTDIDKMFGKNLNLAFDKMTDQQRQLVQNGERLVALTKEATDELTKKNFDRARSLMIEGDIVAYDTSYSLPCRTTKPRVMQVEPVEISADDEAPVIHVRGNFLLQGKGLKVSFAKTEAQVLQRTDTEISFAVPQSVLDDAKGKQIAISATLDGLTTITRKIRFVLGCSEKSRSLETAPSVQFLINPPITFHVQGTLTTSHLVDTVLPDLKGQFSNTGNGHCDDSYSVDQNYCLIDKNGGFDHVDISNPSANCGSSIGPINPSGDHCVFVGGHVQGCGAIRGPFNVWAGCKGRGWVKYDYQLYRKDRVMTEAGHSDIEKEGIPGETLFSFPFPTAAGKKEEMQFTFNVIVQKMRGDKVLEQGTLSQAQATHGTWQANVKDGQFSLTLQ
ncbi:hypothetical protein [Rhizobium rhizogenes]|uniref:Uncharacterized protein n=2 Tax=Rhizobium rhizogenes TaxID=359 RepID=B9JPP1_RHIR8|nr:hypothetical protein [Rhizobium rhizogenes]ACM31110.1 hypothetical protein Arad_12026 [Rhizobium rhizogenes K84]NTG71477.1 hypothetical protein [Rhizobium rhizogenes]NTG77872.1 hypothetical protein [Rhizobium rhizogenes]NTG90573.1 hypothetical protein [Rhizobium rhizogenes]TRB03400.1 hypothetical protein EXN67_29200 [Rhizobium rhizogenes]